jgi:hypothetical protein
MFNLHTYVYEIILYKMYILHLLLGVEVKKYFPNYRKNDK